MPHLSPSVFLSACIAILALTLPIYSWRQVNRPIVSAAITALSGGNMGIMLNIIVENSGTRPAKNIRLIANKADVLAALTTPAEIPMEAMRCFFSGISIPLLIHGRSTSNAFGHLGYNPDSWRAGAEIPIKIMYEDLNGRRFKSKLRLLLADDAGFAQMFWEKD